MPYVPKSKHLIKDMKCLHAGKLLSKRCYGCNGFKKDCPDKVVCIETIRDDFFGINM